jgi:hypothetical protein
MGKKSKPSKPMISNGHTFEESKIKSTTQSQNLEEAEWSLRLVLSSELQIVL